MASDLEIRHCRVLVAVSDERSVSSAARALGLAQSTVSETLLSLERLIGAPVTRRRPGQEARLTAAGAALLPHARALISASEAALATVTAGTSQAIRLGAVESASTYLLPRALTAFRQHWPSLEVQVVIGVCEDLRARVRRGDLDAAMTLEALEDTVDPEGNRSRVLAPAQLCLIVAPPKTAGRHKTTTRNFLRRPLLLPDPDGSFNTMMRAWFETIHVQPRFASAGSIDGVKCGVRRDGFVGVLPAYAVAKELARGEFLELRVPRALPAFGLGLTTLHRPVDSSPLHDMTKCIEAALDPRASPELAFRTLSSSKARVMRRSLQ
jgi:DNA-binding transcriptional LysR family regulator